MPDVSIASGLSPLPGPAGAGPSDAEVWFDSALGRFVLEREHAYFDNAVSDVFGFNALQLGLPQHDFLRTSRMPLRMTVGLGQGGDLVADFHDLPIASNSVDLVVAPHLLEFSSDPHQILRELVRMLIPDGHLVLCGFNPMSLWGLRRLAARGEGGFPWTGRFIHLPRLKDWLALLSCEITGGRMGCYSPPFVQEKWRRRFGFMEAAGDRWWPFGGGVYFVEAVKRVRGMRLITAKWSDSRARRRRFVVVPQRVARSDEAPAIRPRGDGA
jgi:SAM-dependent methyltransferase